MHVNKPEVRYGRWILLILVILPPAFLYLASPVVAVNFSPNGKEEFQYVWNTKNRIHRGDIKHGGSAVEFGYIFPDENFFMRFDWWTDKGFQRCIDITPKWGMTIDVYLDQAGRIDIAKTATEVIARLKQCKGETEPFNH